MATTAKRKVALGLPAQRMVHCVIHLAGRRRGAGLLLPSQQPQRGNHQQGAEDVLNPCESLQQRDPGKNEHPAHDDGAHDSQQQRLSLHLRAKAEGAEHQQEDEQIIDAEGELDQVAGGKFKRPS